MEKTDKQDKLVTVYRVEDKDGDGPYIKNKKPRNLPETFPKLNNHNYDNNHPGFRLDFSSEWYDTDKTYDYVSGFLKPQHIVSWFGGLLKPILKRGFSIMKYKIQNKYIEHSISGRQIAFIKPEKQPKEKSIITEDDIAF